MLRVEVTANGRVYLFRPKAEQSIQARVGPNGVLTISSVRATKFGPVYTPLSGFGANAWECYTYVEEPA